MKKGRKYVREEFTSGLAFMPGFLKLINWVQKKYYTGLVTASHRHNVDWLCEFIDLATIFKHIISGDDTSKNKPHPEPYLAMIKKLNVVPENVIIIEDSLHGLRSALSSGAHVIAKRGSVPDNDLSIAHRIITYLDEITSEMLENILQEKV